MQMVTKMVDDADDGGIASTVPLQGHALSAEKGHSTQHTTPLFIDVSVHRHEYRVYTVLRSRRESAMFRVAHSIGLRVNANKSDTASSIGIDNRVLSLEHSD